MALSYPLFLTIYGAKYKIVPFISKYMSSSSSYFAATPKSASFGYPSQKIKIFYGFKSRYITFSACKLYNPKTTAAKIKTMAF